MLTWEQIVEKYIGKHINQIKATTRPLHDHFGIEYFTYHRIDNDGKYTVLVDRPDWAEYYVQNKLYLLDPYLSNPKAFQSGIDHVNPGIEHLKEGINCDQSVMVIEKNADYVEFFGYIGKSRTSLLHSLHTRHPQILKNFGHHFKKRLNPLLKKMEEEASSLVDLKGDGYYSPEPLVPSVDCLSYFKDLGLDCTPLEKLSPRERECVKHLVQKKTAQETAILLDLSPRTVEFYLENIKNKLGCFTKQELYERVLPFKELL